jgi:hypothetical protein
MAALGQKQQSGEKNSLSDLQLVADRLRCSEFSLTGQLLRESAPLLHDACYANGGTNPAVVEAGDYLFTLLWLT